MKIQVLGLGAVVLFFLNSALADPSVSADLLSCSPAPSGLVSWWQAESNANDNISGNHGLVSGVTFNVGEVGKAFAFTGSGSSYVRIPASSTLDVGQGNGFTVELWCNPATTNAPGAGVMTLLEWNNNSGALTGIGCHLEFYNGGRILGDIVDPNTGSDHSVFSAGGSVTPNVWQHVAMTYDRTTGVLTLFRNGLVVGSGNVGIWRPSTGFDLYFGKRSAGVFAPIPYQGLLDEISLYNRVLSTNEIQAIYNAGSAGKCPPACVPVSSNLISWWRGESNALDSVDGNNGTLLNGAGFAAGEVGQAFALNGNLQVVRIPYAPSLITSNFSVETWVKPATQVSAGVGQTLIFGQGYGHVQLVARTGVSGVRLAFLFGINPSTFYDIVATNEIPIGQFSHVVGTWDGITLKIYINGQLRGQRIPGTKPADSGCPFFIGGFYSPGSDSCSSVSQFFTGVIDEVSYYRRALNAGEIQAIYNAGSAGKCSPNVCMPPPPGLVSWWRGESNALDSVNGNSGTLLNGTGFAAGEVGLAFAFNSSNATIRVPASTSLNVGTSTGLTVECWIRTRDVTRRHPIVEWNTGAGSWGVHFYIDPVSFGVGPGALYANVVDTGGFWHQIHSPAGAVTSNQLQHVAFSYDKATGLAKLYCNGVVVAQQTLGSFTPQTSYNLYLGYRPPTGGETYGFSGLMDEVSLYNRALSDSEIQGIYVAGSAGKCIETVPPFIVVQPQNQTVTVGDPATFLVTAGGTPPLYYQWFHGSNALTGAVATTLTLTNIQTNQAGVYFVVVSNAVGVAISSNALLYVNQRPVADASATDSHVVVCNATNIPVVLDGSRSYDPDGDPLQYSWFGNGIPLATGVVAVVTLTPGTYPIGLVVSDGLAADTNIVTVQVETATQAIADLIAMINNSDVKHQQPLLASLQAASASIERCNPVAAANQLAAFQNKVRAQIAPDEPALAQTWIDAAQEIINSLSGCSGCQTQGHGKINVRSGPRDGILHLEFEGIPGQSYLVEMSTDLVNWTQIGVATDLQNGGFTFDDNNAQGTPTRFYRVVTP